MVTANNGSTSVHIVVLDSSFASAILKAKPIALCATPVLWEVSGVIGAWPLKRLPVLVVREAVLAAMWFRVTGTIGQQHITQIFRADFILSTISYMQ